MKYAAEMGSVAIPGFIKNGSGIQKLAGYTRKGQL
jgi:hypothetical protein